jgi:SagB-type dehydrogenase family enzyme
VGNFKFGIQIGVLNFSNRVNEGRVDGQIMKIIPVTIIAVIFSLLLAVYGGEEKVICAMKGGKMNEEIKLPAAQSTGSVSLEKVFSARRSVRDYRDSALRLSEVAQILWAAQGITAEWGGKTAPSAGATYPLEIYAVVGDVEGLKPGVYHYISSSHSLKKTVEGDLREQLSESALGQRCVAEAPVTVVVTAVFDRTTRRYGERGIRYVHMEVGHVGQNVCLQAETLGLSTVMVGAFRDEVVKGVLKLKEAPLYLIPVGR